MPATIRVAVRGRGPKPTYIGVGDCEKGIFFRKLTSAEASSFPQLKIDEFLRFLKANGMSAQAEEASKFFTNAGREKRRKPALWRTMSLEELEALLKQTGTRLFAVREL